MPVLEIHPAKLQDVYKDMARVPELYRIDSHGKRIPEGRICKVTAGQKGILLSLRGQQEHSEASIYLDDSARGRLGLKDGSRADFQFRQVWLIGQFLWAWRATDPAYRIAARVGAVSVILSFVGSVLGVVGLCISLASRE